MKHDGFFSIIIMNIFSPGLTRIHSLAKESSHISPCMQKHVLVIDKVILADGNGAKDFI